MRAAGAAVLLAALLSACGSEPGEGAEPGGSARPDFSGAHLVMVSLDTLRADGLSLSGAPEGLTPNLDTFARQAVVFDHARAAAPATAPSHMSLLTSTYPTVHGVQNVSKGQHVFALPEEIPTLPEVLQGAGFTTVGLTDGGQLAPSHGFGRGFDAYMFDLSGGDAKVEQGVQRLGQLTFAAEEGGQGPGDGRFFFFWHTYEVHAPYVPPQPVIDAWVPDGEGAYQGPLRETVESLAGLPFREKWKRMASEFWKDEKSWGRAEALYLHALYRAGVHHADALLADLFAAMERHGLYDDAIIVVLSDHGEEFFEHGRFQHSQLFEECLRVPLLIRLPGGWGGGRRVQTPVALLDLMPTLMDLLGVDASAVEGLDMQGRSFAQALLDGTEPEEHVIVSELRFDRPDKMSEDWLIAQHYRGWKFFHDGYGYNARGGSPDFLYDLSSDPAEQDNVAADRTERLQRFQEMLDTWRVGMEVRKQGVEAVAGQLTEEQIQELIELGYLDGD